MSLASAEVQAEVWCAVLPDSMSRLQKLASCRAMISVCGCSPSLLCPPDRTVSSASYTPDICQDNETDGHQLLSCGCSWPEGAVAP